MSVRTLLFVTLGLLLARPDALRSDSVGRIYGRVAAQAALDIPQRRPETRGLGASTTRPAPDRRRSVVYLESGPRGAFSDVSQAPAVIDQRNETFVPRVVAIATGTMVEFPNSDATYHNVFSLSRTKTFDLGRYAQGHSKSERFDRPGVVRVFCDIHSHMSAFVLVFAHRYFATTDRDGAYRIEGVPPGTYTLTVWNEVLASQSRQVTIPPAGGDTEMNFTLSREKVSR